MSSPVTNRDEFELMQPPAVVNTEHRVRTTVSHSQRVPLVFQTGCHVAHKDHEHPREMFIGRIIGFELGVEGGETAHINQFWLIEGSGNFTVAVNHNHDHACALKEVFQTSTSLRMPLANIRDFVFVFSRDDFTNIGLVVGSAFTNACGLSGCVCNARKEMQCVNSRVMNHRNRD